MPHRYATRRTLVRRLVSSSAFTPASLPGLLAWYDASFASIYVDAGLTLATNGQTAQQWNDRSGNGYHVSQATAGKRPTYNSTGFNTRQTVVFSGAVGVLTALLSAASVAIGTGTTGSAFFVGQLTNTTNAGFPRAVSYLGGGQVNDSGNTGSAAWILGDNTPVGSLQTFRNSAALATQAISISTNIRFGIIYNGANATPYLNGVAGTPSANTNAWISAGTLAIGCAAHDATNGNWTGPISEVVTTTGAMSPGEVANLDAYFQTKWGL